MRIGIDIRPLQTKHRYRGIGVYLENLIKSISKNPGEHEYIFYMFTGDNVLERLLASSTFKYTVIPVHNRWGHINLYSMRNLLKQSIRLSKKNLDVFLATDLALGVPEGNVPTVGVAYDLIPLVFSNETFPANPLKILKNYGIKGLLSNYFRRLLYRLQLKQYLKLDRVISISQATKVDFVHYLNIAPGKISVVPLAYDPIFNDPEPSEDALKKFHISRPYLLYTGGSDLRKNLTGLLKAFESVLKSHPDIFLVLAGRDFDHSAPTVNADFWKTLEDSSAKDHIILTGYVSREELRQIYRHALMYVFPSLYEGFGIPILEAMASGLPVIAYKNSSIPEIAGRAALLAENKASLAEPIVSLLEDSSLRASLRKEALEQIKKFSWDKTATQTIKVLEEVSK